MFFYLTKLIWIVQPSSLIVMFIGFGTLAVLRGRKKVGVPLLVVGLLVLLACAFSPLGFALLLPLEDRFPRRPLPESVAGIIILGGFEDPEVSNARHLLAINDAGERLAEALVLARQLPKARVIFTGGIPDLLPSRLDAAGPIGRYLEEAGIARSRIVLERRSRTTYENALFTRLLLNPTAADRWVLVTSAHHMPRAVGVFRRLGYDVVPWPVDYRTRGSQDLLRLPDTVAGGLQRVDTAFKEWVGLVAHRVFGFSDTLWPAPHEAPQ